MSFDQVLKNCQGFTQKLAERTGAQMDVWFSPRRIHIEKSNFVLGAEAIPAPVHAGRRR